MKYLIVTKLNELSNIIAGIEQAGEVVVDLETTSLATHSSTIEIVGIGLCYSDSTAYYLPLINEPAQEIKLSDLSQIIENDSISKIGHNIKYDARVLNRFGLDIKNIKFDTLIASYCLHGDRTKHNLDDLTLEHLNHVKIRTKDVIPRKSKKLPNPTMAHCPIPQVAMYCCEDVYYTYDTLHPSGNIIEGWQQYNAVITIPADATDSVYIYLESTNGSNIYFDDVRIHPYNANMQSFVYNPLNLRLMAQLDENNYATYYEYDDDGTLIRLKKETERGVVTIKETRSSLGD